MCLILLAWRVRTEYPLVLAANRDEFFARPTLPAAPWEESPAVIGGRDLEKGGSWLAVSASGRLAAVTNFRDGRVRKTGARSRGLLVSDFVLSDLEPRLFLERLRASRDVYDGFNLLVAANGELLHYANVSDEITPLEAGIHGLSNHLLDTAWPKVERGKAALRRLMGGPSEALASGLFAALADTQRPPDEELPLTGVPLEWERELARAFIRAPGYGTRASAVVLMGHSGKLTFIERNFTASGEAAEMRTFQLPAARSAAPATWTFA
ncbi:MAG TPA: NRDE family protein [Burkholderiales bacterium]|nr:NRDE family protein [Burkholderiales bacterium]